MFNHKYIIPLLLSSVLIFSCKTPSKKAYLENYTYEKVTWDSAPLSEQTEKRESLIQSFENNLKWLARKKEDSTFQLQNITFTTKDYICSSNIFLDNIKNNEDLLKSLKNNFDLYKLHIEENKNVLYTGYYIPYAEANKLSSKQYQTPVYKKPKDLISVNLEDFSPLYKGKIIRGRVEKNRLVPYWSREEITNAKKLDSKGLEIAWVKDKVDLFFIEIQGSGILIYPNGKKQFIHYSSQNGREYKPIGALLLKEGYLEKKDISMQSIREWLEKNPKEKQRVLNYNKSFVFFSLEDDGPFGNINVKLLPERSIAADQRIFPPGTLALLDFKMPLLPTEVGIKNQDDKESFSQLAFVHDTGGSIKGPNRIDLFWGEGYKAGEMAGVTQQDGSIYILIPTKKCSATTVAQKTNR